MTSRETLDTWRAVHTRHFPGLPFDCGNLVDPGVRYCEDLSDWSHKATTPDQRRMERYIDRYDLRQMRILHVGIGNSSMAQRFHHRIGEIVGTTIDEPEIRVAQSLGLSNYHPVIHNKYSGVGDAVVGRYNFILDNNPTSPCCCIRHLAVMLTSYASMLENDGQIVTDRVGLGWIPEDANQRWSFDFKDLAIVADAAGLSAYQMTGNVYVLSRSTPPAPGLASLARYIARRTLMLPGQIKRNGRRLLRSQLRRMIGAGPAEKR